jgi:hypothetical protein
VFVCDSFFIYFLDVPSSCLFFSLIVLCCQGQFLLQVLEHTQCERESRERVNLLILELAQENINRVFNEKKMHKVLT